MHFRFHSMSLTASTMLPERVRFTASAESTVRRDLQASLADGACFSLMVGLGETYLVAYALALGVSEVTAGLIATVPMLAGAVLQLLSPWAVRRIRSNRRWVVGSASVQALSLALVPTAAWWTSHAVHLLFLCATIYWAAGLASGPAWNTWMEAMVPKSVRTRFFVARSRVCQACLLAAFAAGGLVLHGSADHPWRLNAFAVLFLLAAVCRGLSSWFLSRQSEPSSSIGGVHASLIEAVKNLRGHTGGRLLAYLLVVQVTIQMAGPFFTPYLLSELGVTYLQFMLLIGAGFAGKMWAVPIWGNVAKSIGAQRLLRIGGLAIIPLSAMWMISTQFWYLFVLQILAGIAWSAYELAMLLMFFETIPRHERISLLTVYNVGNAVALVSGSLLGAAMLRGLGVGLDSVPQVSGWSPYLLLFGCSTMMRLATLPFLFRVPDVRFHVVTPSLRVLAVRPAEVATDPPVLSSMPNGEPAASGAGWSDESPSPLPP